MPDGELDYKTMFENSMRTLKERAALEHEYFELLRKFNSISGYQQKVSEHIMEMSIADQVMLLKILMAAAECSKMLCEKYGWADEVEEVEME